MQPAIVRSPLQKKLEPPTQTLTKPSKPLPKDLIYKILTYLPNQFLFHATTIDRHWQHAALCRQIDIIHVLTYSPTFRSVNIIRQLSSIGDIYSLRKIILAANKGSLLTNIFVTVVKQGKFDVLVQVAETIKDPDPSNKDDFLNTLLMALYRLDDFEKAKKIIWMFSPDRRNFAEMGVRLTSAGKLEEVEILINDIKDAVEKQRTIFHVVGVHRRKKQFDLALKYVAMLKEGFHKQDLYQQISSEIEDSGKNKEALKFTWFLEKDTKTETKVNSSP